MIKVKIKFRIYETLITDEAAQMVVKYKEPGSIFYKKLEKHISGFVYPYHHPRGGYKNPHYFDEVKEFMSNIEKIKKTAKEMILQDIASNRTTMALDKSAKNVKDLIKGKTIKFEFEFEEDKE